MSGVEWWRRVVLDPELDRLGSSLPGNFGNNTEAKIDARSDTTCSDHVAISNDPGFLVRGPDKRQ